MTTAIHDTIVTAEQAFMTAFSKGDPAAVAEFYTEDGQVLPPNSDFVTGRQAIQSLWQALMDMGIKGLTLDTIEVEALGDAASEVGRYTLTAEGGQVLDQGKYMIVWKQEGGEWKLHRDMFNTSMPAPA